MRKAGSVFLILLGMGLVLIGAVNRKTPNQEASSQEAVQNTLSEAEDFLSDEPREEPSPEKTEQKTYFYDFEKNGNTWANKGGTRICYEDGYYYYASQSDHYFLYRAREDGSDFRCLAKVHPGNICVQDGKLYFVNQSDGYGIYRMNTDGADMEKLCERGRNLQLFGEYLYFCSTYEAEYDRRGMVTEEPSEFDDDFLYRMKKDGTERELIAIPYGGGYVLSDIDPEAQDSGAVYYTKRTDNEFAVCRTDLDGQNVEELCRGDSWGAILAYGGSIYYGESYYGTSERISRLNPQNGETVVYQMPLYRDCCIYNGYLYTMREEMQEDGRKVGIWRTDLDGENCELIYENVFRCKYPERGSVSDLYAAETGVFFRQYVSEREGCRWFRLTEDEENGTWRAEIWEDWEGMAVTGPAWEITGDAEVNTVMSFLKSTDGYEACLAEDLESEEYYRTDQNGEKCNPYQIRLPQFNSKIAGYEKINRYFQNAFQEAEQKREAFFKMLGEEGDQDYTITWYEETDYGVIYIGEKYITVERYESGYQGGRRGWRWERPVSFDRESGETVSLEQILGVPQQEAVARLTGSVYKYMEGIGRGEFLLQNEDMLTENYDPEQFFLLPEGIGIYYGIYAIDSGAAGDYVFVIPWEEATGILDDA